MKWTVFNLAVLVGLGSLAPTYAQSSHDRAPVPGQFSNYVESAESSPSDQPSESETRPTAPDWDPREAPPAPEYAPTEVYEETVVSEEPAEVEPWHLFAQDRSVQLYGWVAAGATANARDPVSRYNGPLSFNDRNEVQLDQLYAILEKPLDENRVGWDIGARVDLLYGSDYVFTQAAGLETRSDFSPKWNSGVFYGLAMPQLYADIANEKLSIRLGHFYTIIGYEVVTAPDNFFASHAYTMQYGEPFTHTGGRALYQLNDRWSVVGGVVNGWDKWDAVTNRAAFLGGATYTPEHERYSLAFSLITGEEDGAFPPILGSRTMYSLVFSFDVTDRLQYVLQHDNGWQEDGLGATQDTRWYGLNQYLFYTLNDNWKAGVRGEWFKDADGTRVTGVRATNPFKGGSAGDFYEVSLGVNWTRCTNVTVRPEVRWDWFEGEGTRPYDDNTKNSQFVAGFDVIVSW